MRLTNQIELQQSSQFLLVATDPTTSRKFHQVEAKKRRNQLVHSIFRTPSTGGSKYWSVFDECDNPCNSTPDTVTPPATQEPRHAPASEARVRPQNIMGKPDMTEEAKRRRAENRRRLLQEADGEDSTLSVASKYQPSA